MFVFFLIEGVYNYHMLAIKDCHNSVCVFVLTGVQKTVPGHVTASSHAH